MITLAIDPAVSKQTAFALFMDGELKLWGKIDLAKDLAILIECHTPDIVVTEQMYLGENVKTYGQLSEEVGKIKLICELYDIRYRLILASTWQAHHGLRGIKNRDMRKQLEDKIIETVIDEAPTDVDIRSAILIGMCHIEQARMKI